MKLCFGVFIKKKTNKNTIKMTYVEADPVAYVVKPKLPVWVQLLGTDVG